MSGAGALRSRRSVSAVVAVLTVVALGAGACSKGGGSSFPDDDASADGDGESPQSGSSSSGSHGGSSSGSTTSGSSSSSSGGHGSSSSGSGSGGTCTPAANTKRVTSSVSFTDAGVPLCGTAVCELTNHVCCVDYNGNGTCLAAGSACPASTSPIGSIPQAQFNCLQASDCPCGSVCCATANDSTQSSSAGSTCQDISKTGACQPVADAGAQSKSGSAQLCQTDEECPSGNCGWQVCDVTTPYGAAYPNLTMCGLQASAPFNCQTCPGPAKCDPPGN